MASDNRGLITNIQNFSIHDGPGIRTTVFLKGCNMRCFWCHNPETINVNNELQLFPQKCIGCGKCFTVCPVGAHDVVEEKRVFKRELCIKCGKCSEVCCSEAVKLAGQLMTVDQVMSEILKDKLFYENSNGGVTISGGEPLLQCEFTRSLLIECKKQKLHTVVETAGNVPWTVFESILPFVDLFLYDIKTVDPLKHKLVTCCSNERLLENISKLGDNRAKIWIRIPIIPGINDNSEEIYEIAFLIRNLKGIEKVELLPFHNMGSSKYDSLDLQYEANNISVPTAEAIDLLKDIFFKC